MSTPLAVIGGLFAAVYLVVAWLAIRRRLLGRLALREGIRRPGQTLLVVGGLMVGAASITAALVGSDSAHDSSVLNAYRSWGQTDLTVEANGKVFPDSVAKTIADDPSLQPLIDGVQPGLELVGSVSNRDTKESDSGVRLIGFDPNTQAAFGPYTLTNGETTLGEDLGKKGVLVSRQLADEMDVHIGDELVMGVERAEKLHPSPHDIGRRLKNTVKKLEDLQKKAEKKASASAEKAGKKAAASVAGKVQAEAQAQAAAAAQAALLAQRAYEKQVKQILQEAEEAGVPPPPIPPPPVPAVPPAPDPALIQAQAQAAAQAAAEQAALKVQAKFGKRAKGLQKQLEHLQNVLDRTIDRLKPVHLTVAGVAKSQGPGAYGLFSAVFAPLDLAQRIGHTDEINIVRISGKGDVQTGLDSAARAVGDMRSIVADIPSEVSLTVKQAKKSEIDAAEDSTEFTFAMLVGMSMLVLAAGVALVINLTQMLAEERRSRLGILRAMGLTRRGLVTLSVLEGALYSLLAAAVGTGVGLFAGRILAQRFGEAFAEFFGASVDYEFVFSIKPVTLATAFAAGALVTLGTLFFSAWRTSRLSIPAAIRNLPEPARETRRRRRWPRMLGALALLAAGAGGISSGQAAGRLLGGVALIVLLAALVRGRVPDRIRTTAYGLGLAAWAFYMVRSISDEDDPNKFFAVFTMAVLIAVVGLSLAAASNLRVVERLSGVLGLVFRRLRATLRPPLAFLARRRMRTGLSIIMFAVVMAIISMMSSFLFIFRPHYERDSLGYDVMVTAAGKDGTTLPPDVRKQIEKRAVVDTRIYTGSLKSQFVNLERTFAPMYALTDEQFADPPLRLSSRDDRFDTDAEVWQTVRTDPEWIVSDFGNPGDKITLEGEDGQPVPFRIAANPSFGLFTGMTGPKETFEPFGDLTKGKMLLLAVKPGVDASAVAGEIERKKYKDGVTSQTTRELMERGYRANRTFFSVIDVLMKMGLVVGILSLGILTLRAVVERRHVIGVLRALGYHKRGVMAGLLVEAGATTTLGVAVGCAAGITMGYIFFKSFFEQAIFGIEWPTLRGALILVYVAVLVVTIGPAWRASRLPPAEAVRYTE